MMWGYYSGMGGWMIFWMILSSVVWLALVGVAVWALVRWVSHASRTQGNTPLHGSMTDLLGRGDLAAALRARRD